MCLDTLLLPEIERIDLVCTCYLLLFTYVMDELLGRSKLTRDERENVANGQGSDDRKKGCKELQRIEGGG